MKLVHFGEFAPHRCGLYHTMKDLIKAEKGVGIDAHFVSVAVKDEDCNIEPGGKIDGILTTSDVKVASDADVLVRHTVIPNELENTGIPIIMAIHGRPKSSLLMDDRDETPVIQAFHNKGTDARYKAFFTFWTEHLPFWRCIIPKHKLHYVPAMVDLMDWRPGRVRPFDFKEHNGRPNILIADIWRDDVTPFDEILAVAKFIKEECPAGRLHIAAALTNKGPNIFWRALRNEGVLGYAVGQTKDIKALYAAADMVVTPHTIATRIIRESLAMGIPIVAGRGCQWTPYTIETIGQCWKDIQANGQQVLMAARQTAERNFNLKQTGAAMLKLLEKILERKSERRKVLIDLGGHLGETVRRFYKEVDDARFYDIFTFEPHPKCFKKLQSNLAGLKNVKFRNKAVVRIPGGQKHESRTLFPAKDDSDGGSTLLKGKTTGDVNYANSYTVRCIDLKQMIHTNYGTADYVVLKVNIEGGEYELMQYILDANLMKCFNQIYVQTHKTKLNPKDKEKYKILEDDFTTAAMMSSVQLFMQDRGMARFQCEEVTA